MTRRFQFSKVWFGKFLSPDFGDSYLAEYCLVDSCFMFYQIPVQQGVVQQIYEIDLTEYGLAEYGLAEFGLADSCTADSGLAKCGLSDS